jgi:hypothetical protein
VARIRQDKTSRGSSYTQTSKAIFVTPDLTNLQNVFDCLYRPTPHFYSLLRKGEQLAINVVRVGYTSNSTGEQQQYFTAVVASQQSHR